MKTEDLDDVIRWICEYPPGTSWARYSRIRAWQAAESALDSAQDGYEDWRAAVFGEPAHDDVQDLQWPVTPVIRRELTPPKRPRGTFLNGANPCPVCGTPAEQLIWDHIKVSKVYGPLCGHGWEGWITVCHTCKICVQIFYADFWVS